MSENTQNISELSHSPESLSSISRIEDIIGVAPEYSDKIRRYDKQISLLSPAEQAILIEKWQQEVTSGTANMRVFGTLILGFRTSEIKKEEVQVQGKEDQVQGKEDQVQGKEDQVQGKEDQKGENQKKNKENHEKVTKAAEGALKSGEKIQGVIGTVYSPEIDARIQKDKSEIENPDSEISKLLTSMGIEAGQALTTPGVEKILQARAMTQVYLANQEEITRSHPELKSEIREFEGYRFDLGIEESTQAKNVNKLLSDIPRDTRGQVVDTVTTLTASKPDTVVTRTGDTLRFTDPKNEKYSYEIDLAKYPPELAKRLDKLSIKSTLIEKIPQEKELEQKGEKKEGELLKSIESSKDTPITPELDNIQSDARYEMDRLFTSGKEKAKDKNPLEGLQDTINGVGIKISILTYLIQEKKDIGEGETADTRSLEDKLRQTLNHKESLLTLEMEYTKIQKELGAIRKSSKEGGTWEENAEISLKTLSDMGFQELGDNSMSDFIEAWNYQNRDSKEFQITFEGGSMDPLSKNALEVFIDKKLGFKGQSRNEKFQSLKEKLRDINFIQENWNNKEKRAQYLFGDNKKSAI